MGTIQSNTHIKPNNFPVNNSADQSKTAGYSSPSTLKTASQVGARSLTGSQHGSSAESSSSSSSIREYTPINNEVRKVSPLGDRQIRKDVARAIMEAAQTIYVEMKSSSYDPLSINTEANKVVSLMMQNNISLYPEEEGGDLTSVMQIIGNDLNAKETCEKIQESIPALVPDLFKNFEEIKNGEGADTPDGYEKMVTHLKTQGLSVDNACFLLINAGTIDGFDESGNAFKEGEVLNFNKNHLETAAQPYEGSARHLASVLDGKIGDLANNIGEKGEERALKALAKELNKQDKDVDGFIAQVRNGAHINEEGLLNDKTINKLRAAIKEQLFESKGNQKILGAARELVLTPEDPGAIASLAKAMHAKNMNPEQMKNLVRKMGEEEENFTPLNTQETTDKLNLAKKELEAKDAVQKQKRAKLVSIAAVVLAVGLGVLAVGMFAAGIAVLASIPLAMPLGIALIGAGGVFTMLAMGAIGGSYISNKEEFEAAETARLQQPPQQPPQPPKDKSGERLAKMLNDELESTENTGEEDERSSPIDNESSKDNESSNSSKEKLPTRSKKTGQTPTVDSETSTIDSETSTDNSSTDNSKSSVLTDS